ncbi:hypothetical protein [Microbacterium aerolatum]|uniref:hypothetical protein n=1 Tax=Microbacterium aerolatum TaxID=153731 RepID=UPI0011BF07A2|nr:hypothetical protein [Microbacterium aerolatum]
MSNTASRRISTGIAWGAFAVLAWAAVTLMTSTGTAQADEETDGPLNGLTSLVGSTVGTGTELVSDVVTETVVPVVEHVAPVVTETVPAAVAPVTQTVSQTVEAVPVVRDVVPPVLAPVTEKVAETATEVAAPVTQLPQESPVSQVTDPLLDTVSKIGIVGDVLDDLSVADAVTDISRAVDATTGSLGRTVADAAPPLLDTVDQVVPDAPDVSVPSAPVRDEFAPAPSPASSVVPATATFNATAFSAADTSMHPLAAMAAAPTGAVAEVGTGGEPADPVRAAHAPPGSPAPSSSAGHGGVQMGEAARLGDAAADSLRAWKHTLGATDDALPCSPVSEADVSPD